MSKKEFDYKKSMDKLEELLDTLDSEELDVDTAVERFEEGMKLVDGLEEYLTTAENKITELKERFTS